MTSDQRAFSQIVIAVEPGTVLVLTSRLCREILADIGRSRSEAYPCIVCGQAATSRAVFYANPNTLRMIREMWSLKAVPWTVVGTCDEHYGQEHAEQIAGAFQELVTAAHQRIRN